MTLQSSPDNPASVRVISQLIGQWIDRLGPVWMEGQVAQLTLRPGTNVGFLALRDTVANLSLQVSCPRHVLDQVQPSLEAGSQVIVHAKPSWYFGRGSLSLAASEIRAVGVGQLLARLARLQAILAAEGLFDPRRKRPLPFLPRTVGLVCGRSSAAERDVVENARRRWPGLPFRIETAAVQGPSAAAQVIDALRQLDRDPKVDVIVVARGGGSVEDLLPFSDEALLREVAVTRTPVVSAIGHESDTPLLDLVADVRASTPTDAAKLIVPDLAEQLDGVARARLQLRTALRGWLRREHDRLTAMRSRPALAAPRAQVDDRAEALEALRHRARRSLVHNLDRSTVEVEHVRARVRSLSPLATLNRGYAVVQTDDGHLVRDAADVTPGALVSIRTAAAAVTARVETTDPAPDH